MPSLGVLEGGVLISIKLSKVRLIEPSLRRVSFKMNL